MDIAEMDEDTHTNSTGLALIEKKSGTDIPSSGYN